MVNDFECWIYDFGYHLLFFLKMVWLEELCFIGASDKQKTNIYMWMRSFKFGRCKFTSSIWLENISCQNFGYQMISRKRFVLYTAEIEQLLTQFHSHWRSFLLSNISKNERLWPNLHNENNTRWNKTKTFIISLLLFSFESIFQPIYRKWNDFSFTRQIFSNFLKKKRQNFKFFSHLFVIWIGHIIIQDISTDNDASCMWN